MGGKGAEVNRLVGGDRDHPHSTYLRSTIHVDIIHVRTSEAALVHGAEPLVVERSRRGVKQPREELAQPWTFKYAKDLLGVGEVVLALHERDTSHTASGRQDPLRGKCVAMDAVDGTDEGKRGGQRMEHEATDPTSLLLLRLSLRLRM